MRPYRDAVTRISLRQVRAQFSPREFAVLKDVLVRAGSASTLVKITSVPSSSAHGGRRRWMLCPNPICSRQTSVIGLVRHADGSEIWACFRCAAWKSRPIARTARSAA